MKRTAILVAVLTVSCCSVGDAQSSNAVPTCQVAQCFAAISAAVSHGEVGRVEILHVSPALDTLTRITPAALERVYETKLVIRNLAETSLRDKLIRAINQTSAEPRSPAADLRWGIIFYSAQDLRLGSIYFERSGRSGAVNDQGASFKGDLFHWLEVVASGCPDH